MSHFNLKIQSPEVTFNCKSTAGFPASQRFVKPPEFKQKPINDHFL